MFGAGKAKVPTYTASSSQLDEDGLRRKGQFGIHAVRLAATLPLNWRLAVMSFRCVGDTFISLGFAQRRRQGPCTSTLHVISWSGHRRLRGFGQSQHIGSEGQSRTCLLNAVRVFSIGFHVTITTW